MGKGCKKFNQEDAGEAFVGTNLEQLNKIINDQKKLHITQALNIPLKKNTPGK